jgi:hypothetical protein
MDRWEMAVWHVGDAIAECGRTAELEAQPPHQLSLRLSHAKDIVMPVSDQ